MKKWILLDQVQTPDGKTLSLHEHDGHYTIRVSGVDLMSTRQHASEEKLARLACAHLQGKKRSCVLIGGLGFGFTLQAALSSAPSDSTLVVAEIMAAVVSWNRNSAYRLGAESMADPRVEIVQRDVADIIERSSAAFDSILLDVDNGPAALSTERNERLYQRSGLVSAKSALRPGGCLGIWSAGADPKFAKLMSQTGFTVEVQRCRSHTTSGAWHTLFLGHVR